jgi:hypothetical protein
LGNKLNPEDICGGTITLSNIGAIGGKFGSPLLNLPEVSIIAIGRIQKVPQFADDGNLYPASIMTVSKELFIFLSYLQDYYAIRMNSLPKIKPSNTFPPNDMIINHSIHPSSFNVRL